MSQRRQIPLEMLQTKSLFVATPMYGNQCYGSYMNSCLELQRICLQHNIKIEFHFLYNESLVPRARNYCVDAFLESDCNYLMFIDADIGFNPLDVLELLSYEKEVTCAPYPKKCISWERVYKAAKSGIVEEQSDPSVLENFIGDYVLTALNKEENEAFEPIEVREAGTGFMLITRWVLEKYKETYPEFEYYSDERNIEELDSKKIFAFFDTYIDPDGKRYLSEDFMFCKFARKAGIKIWMCPWIRLEHIGNYTFR